MLGVHSSNSSKCHAASADGTDSEENVALLPPSFCNDENLLNGSSHGVGRRVPSPQPPTDLNGRPRAKSLFGSGSGGGGNRLSLQVSPPSPTLVSCNAEKIVGHWSDQAISNGESGQEDHHAIIFDDQFYDPAKLGPNAGAERPRRKSFAREALDLFYGLNPPPRSLSVADFGDVESKSLSNRQIDKELKRSHNKDLNLQKSPNNISSPVSEKLKLGSGKDSCIFDNFDEPPRSPYQDGASGKSDEKVSL
jgi:hypothetical protein